MPEMNALADQAGLTLLRRADAGGTVNPALTPGRVQRTSGLGPWNVQ